MKAAFLSLAAQNIQAAELLFNAGLYDACANRAYFACFHAALAACLHFGVKVKSEHAVVLRVFCANLIAGRKVFPATFKSTLYDLQNLRAQADYDETPVPKRTAQTALKTAKEICSTIFIKATP